MVQPKPAKGAAAAGSQAAGTAKGKGAAKGAAIGKTLGTGVVVGKPLNGRTLNARELRRAFVEIKQSPDGADPDPLTVPRCVECPHCGWPVYPRDAKVATKKTFARAGIERSSKKEEDEKKKAQAFDEDGYEIIQDGEGDGEASEDSRDTVERLSDELEDLRDKNEELELRNDQLETENKDLTQQLKETQEQLAQAEEKIEFLEEAEVRWRDKLTRAKGEIERISLILERASLISADREGGLVAALEEIGRLRMTIAKFTRRREFMLAKLGLELGKRTGIEYLALVFRLWHPHAVQEGFLRRLEELELRRQREVQALKEEVDVEKQKVSERDAHIGRLKDRFKQAGHAKLVRALGSAAWPSALSHALYAWVGALPALFAGNRLEAVQSRLTIVEARWQEQQTRADTFDVELKQVTEERNKLAKDSAKYKEELEFVMKNAGDSKQSIMARMAEEKAKEEAAKQALAESENRFKEATVAWDEERTDLELQVKTIESRLALAEAAAASGGGGGAGGVREEDEAGRIVPRGQGVLCVACLKQLVHRTVQPLPPMAALSSSAQRLDKAKKLFFQDELQGAANPDDALHAHAWNTRKDPYGISRLTVIPASAMSKPAVRADLSPTSTPKTGLPALKKHRSMQALGGGTASPLRTSMRDFRPKNFR